MLGLHQPSLWRPRDITRVINESRRPQHWNGKEISLPVFIRPLLVHLFHGLLVWPLVWGNSMSSHIYIWVWGSQVDLGSNPSRHFWDRRGWKSGLSIVIWDCGRWKSGPCLLGFYLMGIGALINNDRSLNQSMRNFWASPDKMSKNTPCHRINDGTENPDHVFWVLT